MRTAVAVASLLLFVALSACAAVYTPRQPMPIDEVVRLSKSNTSPQEIIARIRSSGTAYALRGSDFAKLKAAGVPDPVLDYLQQSFVDDMDLLTRYWVLGETLGGCDACYPQPVDLATLDGGGNGMAPEAGLGMRYDFARPPGVPLWVPASPNTFRATPLTVAEVGELAGRGVPEQELVQRIEQSYLDGLIATGGIKNISTHLEAGLKGSEFAALSREGVSDAVLDALQAKFLAQWIEFARIRYQNLGKGSPQAGLFF